MNEIRCRLEQMSPGPSDYDGPNGVLGYAVLLCQHSLRDTSGDVRFPDRLDLFGSQSAGLNRFAAWTILDMGACGRSITVQRATFGDHVRHVPGVIRCEQMRRSNTRAVVTVVADKDPLTYDPVFDHVRIAGSAYAEATDVELSIPTDERISPNPTGAKLRAVGWAGAVPIDLRPEPIEQMRSKLERHFDSLGRGVALPATAIAREHLFQFYHFLHGGRSCRK